jgi:heavy metal sensor kinase
MRRPFPIRFRLTVWYATALGAGLAVFAFAIWFSMRQSLLSDMDQMLADDAQGLEKFANHEIGEPGVKLAEEIDEYFHAYPRGTVLSIRNRSGSVHYTSIEPFPFRATEAGGRLLHTAQWNRRDYRVLTKTIYIGGEPCHVLIAVSLEGIERVLNRLALLLMALSPLIAITAVIGGAWLSRRALKPVDEITEAARSIRISNLSERLDVPRTGDELERLSQTLNDMLSRLESAVRSLTRFTADASHEIRTPLSIIRTTAEIAARRARTAESYRDALNQIVAEAERMTHLVDDLLVLARCDSESVEMQMGVVDLAALVRETCMKMQPLAEARSIELGCRGASGPLLLMANDSAIRRLVLVLLDNALKYTPGGGTVAVTLAAEGSRIVLEVADTGPGIPEPERAFIFERFYRTAEARLRVQTGSGLGLSLAAGIAERHGARISLETEEGGGSRFRVFFPTHGGRIMGTTSPKLPASVQDTGNRFASGGSHRREL